MSTRIQISRKVLDELISIWSEPNPIASANDLSDVFATIMDREIRERQAREVLVDEYFNQIRKDETNESPSQ